MTPETTIDVSPAQSNAIQPVDTATDEKRGNHLEHVETDLGNLRYDDEDEEPELHMKTWIALAALIFMQMTMIMAVQGPPPALSFIGASLNAPASVSWVSNSLVVALAVLGPLISFASDTFQARKFLLVGCALVAFVGSTIAPGSQSLGRLVAAQALVGVGVAATPLSYAVPSEILPRRWRPLVQGVLNVAAAVGAIIGPLTIGALLRKDPVNGWRRFWWFEAALWMASAIAVFVGYHPPKRHTRLDHLSIWQKIGHLDLPGFGLLTAGLTLFLVGLGIGGSLYPWTNARVLSTLVIGIAVLIGFGIYEWKGTSTGIMHHDLFRGGKRGRTFSVLIVLIFIEGVMLFAFTIFYPQMNVTLFVQDPFLLVVRNMPWQVAAGISSFAFGWVSSHFRRIREPLFFSYVLYTAGLVGWATIQPGQGLNALIFCGLAGFGFGGPLILITAGVQLFSSHKLIATATAVSTSARAIGASVFTAIYFAAWGTQMKIKVPEDIGKVAAAAGLSPASTGEFIGAIASNNATALGAIDGVNSTVIAAGHAAYNQAFADSVRVVFIIATAFGVVACILCFGVADIRHGMNYKVDAPVEELHGKHEEHPAPSGPGIEKA